MERQQVGRNTWKKIAEIPGVSSYQDTGVERGRKYCYRIRAVTAEGTSEVMETEEMQAGTLGKQSWLLTKLNHTEITECKLHILIFIVGFICLQQKRKLFIMKCQIDDLVTAHCHQFSKRFKNLPVKTSGCWHTVKSQMWSPNQFTCKIYTVYMWWWHIGYKVGKLYSG